MLELNLLSLMAGFGVGGVAGEFFLFALALYTAYPKDPYWILPTSCVLCFLLVYVIVIDWHSIALTFLGAALYHFAAFAKRKCLAKSATV